MSRKPFRSAIAILFVLAVAAPAAVAQSSSDACSLLTQAQVSAAVSAQVSASASADVTPTFKATCTWTAPGKIITLMTEGTDPFNADKTPISPAMQIVPAPGIGDDAYYVVIGNMVSLLTKKGSTAFKTTVYCSKLPVATLESMESALAQQVASEL
ncbi:MAG: hypothetical protein WCF30_04825 [Terracidiphilus sp.]